MTFEDLSGITDEIEQIKKTYEIFNEDTRLNHSRAARVEFLTNVRYIEKYLRSDSTILDIGAGAGEYSLYFSRKGHHVTAVELSERNIEAFRRKLTQNDDINLIQGNAVDLSSFADESFDIVLLFGPLYHLHGEADRQKCIAEARRVCKKDGVIFFAFISNDMVILTEICYNPKFLLGNTYDHESFKAEDFPFVFFTLEDCRRILGNGGIKVIHEVASDGVSEMIAEIINSFDDYSWEQYLKYHFYTCEKPEMLGRSNHLLFVGR